MYQPVFIIFIIVVIFLLNRNWFKNQSIKLRPVDVIEYYVCTKGKVVLVITGDAPGWIKASADLPEIEGFV